MHRGWRTATASTHYYHRPGHGTSDSPDWKKRKHVLLAVASIALVLVVIAVVVAVIMTMTEGFPEDATVASSARRALKDDETKQAESIKPSLLSMLEAAKGTGMMRAAEHEAKESLEEKRLKS